MEENPGIPEVRIVRKWASCDATNSIKRHSLTKSDNLFRQVIIEYYSARNKCTHSTVCEFQVSGGRIACNGAAPEKSVAMRSCHQVIVRRFNDVTGCAFVMFGFAQRVTCRERCAFRYSFCFDISAELSRSTNICRSPAFSVSVWSSPLASRQALA